MNAYHPEFPKLLPGDLVSIEFSSNPNLRHYGIVAKNISYIYDFSEDSEEIIKIQKRHLKKFLHGNRFRIETISEKHQREDRIITLERATILTRIYRNNISKQKQNKLPRWLRYILDVYPGNSFDYNLFYRNCEHAATWCKIGEWKSRQIKKLFSPTGWLSFFLPTPKSILTQVISNLSDIIVKAKNLFFGNSNTNIRNNYYVNKNLLFIEYTFYHFLFRIELLFNKEIHEVHNLLKINSLNKPLIKECENLLKLDRIKIISILLTISLIIGLIFYSINKHNTSTSIINPTVGESYIDNNNNYCYYQVKQGDTLRIITKKFYNNEKGWEVIYNKNKSIIGNNPDKIKQGMLLKIPVNYNFPTQKCPYLKK